MLRTNNDVKAIAIFLLATICFSILNSLIKIAAINADPYVIMIYRCGLGALMMFGMVCSSKDAAFKMFNKYNIFKGIIDFISIPLWVIALAHLKIGEVVSISYATPLISAFLAVVFLKEQMNIHKLLVLVLGVAGVLIIIQPSSSIFNPYSILVLIACFLWGMTVIFTKKLTNYQHPFLIVFYSNFFAFCMALPVAVTRWQWIDTKTSLMLFAVALMAIIANTLVTKAYKLTDVTNVIPFDYNRLLFSTMLGYVLLGEVIELHTYVGAVIILFSTFYLAIVLKREKKSVTSQS